MSRSHIAYGPKDAIGKVITGRHIPTNCLVITKVEDPAEEAELLYFDKDYTPHQISMRHVFPSMEVATEWVGKYYCVGRHIVVKDGDEWHSYIVGDDNELIVADGTDKVSIVIAGDASVVVNGETMTPTISVNLDPEFANGLAISEGGLMLNLATDSKAGAMSAADKFKLSEIEAGAQVNRITDIETGSANGTISVNGVDVPVKGLGSAAFTDSDAYTPIGVGMSYVIVQELPSDGAVGVIYLVPNEGEGDNVYDEFLFVNGEPELIGTTETDLSDYYTKGEVVNVIRSEVDDAIMGKVDTISLARVATTGSFNDLNDKPGIPIVLDVTKRNDGLYHPSITYQQGIAILESGGQLSIHWPENNLVYQCKQWRSTSSSIFFGTQDENTHRVLRWNSLTGTVEPFSNNTFATAADLSDKVDKVSGKGLSTNDFTNAEKNKLAGFGDASLYALKTDLELLYRYKGSVATESALPNSGTNVAGDVYNVEETGMNYAWNGTSWDALGADPTEIPDPVDVDPISNSSIDDIIGSDSSSLDPSDAMQTVETDRSLSHDGVSADAKATGDAIAAEASARQTQVAALQNAVGSPLVANTAAGMTSTDKIYVYTGSETGYTAGHWYYHDGSAWTDGGVYNSTAFNTDTTLSVGGMAADAEATGDEITDLKSALGEAIGATELPFTLTNQKVIDGEDGAERDATVTYYASNFIDVSMASKIEVFSAFHNYFTYAFYNENQQFISGLAQTPSEYNNIAHKYVVTVPQGAKYFRFTVMVANTSGVTTETAYVKTAFDNLVELTNAVALKADKTYVDNLVDADIYLPFTTENAKVVYGTDGEVVAANTNYYLTSMIELPECYTLEFYTAFHNNFGGAFYDENQTFISGVTYASGYNDLAHVYTVSVPEGAKYFRFTILATTITGISVGQAYIKTIVKNTTELEGEIKTVERNVTGILDEPVSTLPEYIKNILCYRSIGGLSKGYICMTADDGAEGLATYTIPMLLEKEVPCTFGLLSTSAVLTNASYLETLQSAIDAGCAVAMHGSAQWASMTEKALNDYFDTTEAFFANKGITEVQGAICPGGANADTNTMVQCVAGGRYGVVCSGGLHGGEIWYGDDYHMAGARTNAFAINRFSAIWLDTQAKIQAIVDYAYDNHLILMPFWHDYTVITDSAYKSAIEGMIDYAKTKGLEFITLGQIKTII